MLYETCFHIFTVIKMATVRNFDVTPNMIYVMEPVFCKLYIEINH